MMSDEMGYLPMDREQADRPFQGVANEMRRAT